MTKKYEGKDCFIADRGFQRCKQSTDYFKLHCPVSKNSEDEQLTQEQADASRLVTRVRHTVERNFGRLKAAFRFLDSRIDYKYVVNNDLHKIYRIIASISNAFFQKLAYDAPNDELDLQTIQNRNINSKNQFTQLFQNDDYNSGWKSRSFKQLCNQTLIKEFSLKDIRQFECGVWGLELSKQYLNNATNFKCYVHSQLPSVIKVRGIQSKHKNQSRTVFYNFNTQLQTPKYLKNKNCTIEWVDLGYNGINHQNILTGNLGHCYTYCTCIQGNRTIGSCAHVTAGLVFFAIQFTNSDIKTLTQNSQTQNDILTSIHDITKNKKKRNLELETTEQNNNPKKKQKTNTKNNKKQSQNPKPKTPKTNNKSNSQQNNNTTKNKKQPNYNDIATFYKSNHYILLENKTAKKCHINSAINIFIQSPHIVNLITKYKFPRHNNMLRAAASLKAMLNSYLSHTYSMDRFCSFMEINLQTQEDASLSLLKCLTLVSFLKNQQNIKENLDYQFAVETQTTHKDSTTFTQIYDNLNILSDCKESNLKKSIEKYFNQRHYAEPSEKAKSCFISHKLKNFPKILFITLNWRLECHKDKAIEKGKRKIQAKCNKTKSKTTKTQNTQMLDLLRNCAKKYTKKTDACNFSQKMHLTINKMTQNYTLIGLVSHIGDIVNADRVSGHYVSYLKHNDNNNYFLINDSQITQEKIKFKEMHNNVNGKNSETAYIFVYSSYNIK